MVGAWWAVLLNRQFCAVASAPVGLSRGVSADLARFAATHASWDAWQEFADLDTLLEAIGDGADDRLAFQASFPPAPR